METTTISVRTGGVTHAGVYAARDGLITVMTVYGSKTTELGQSPPETLAWLMMLEIVREETARRDDRVWAWPAAFR